MTIAAIRYNNPGNVSLPIKGWTGGGSIVGISGQPGYASFPDMQTGAAALQQRLSTRISGGYNTISSLNTVYAINPDGSVNTSWANGVSSLSGIGANETLDPNNASQMSSLTNGIIQQETGMTPAQLGLNATPENGGYFYIPKTYSITGGSTGAGDSTGIDSEGNANQSSDNGALTMGSDWSQLQLADANGDGQVTQAELDAYNATQSGTKTIAGVSAASEGKPTDVPTAIVTAGNQQAQTQADALKAIAAGAAASSQATNATNTGLMSQFLQWAGGRVLQLVVFALALIFIGVGLWFFVPKTEMGIPG